MSELRNADDGFDGAPRLIDELVSHLVDVMDALGLEEPRVILSGPIAKLFQELAELLRDQFKQEVDNAESTSVGSNLTSTTNPGGNV